MLVIEGESVTTITKNLETLRDDVRVGDIFLDEAYGRALNRKNLDRLIASWDRDRVGAIYLSLRDDGQFACLDGWHRVTACRTVEGEDASLPARVYLDLTGRDEAELFTAFNRDRATPTPGAVFRARLAAGEPAALAIQKIVDDLGLSIAFSGNHHTEGAIQSPAALDRIYSQYGGAMLREVLITIRNTMGTNALNADVLRGLAAFIVRYGEIADRGRLYGILETKSRAQLLATAHAVRTMTPSIDVPSAIGMALVQFYNTGLKSKQLPPWQARFITPDGREALREHGRQVARKNFHNLNGQKGAR